MICVCIPTINREDHVLHFEVQAAVLRPGTGVCFVTGNVDRVIEETVQVALSLIKRNPSLLQGKTFDFQRTDLHVHMTDGGILKEGSSAGVGIMLALLLGLTETRDLGDLTVLATGEIDLYGGILGVGAVKEKLEYFDKTGRFDYMIVPSDEKIDGRRDVLCIDSVLKMWPRLLEILQKKNETVPVCSPAST